MSTVVILDSDQIPEGISSKFVRFPGENQEQFFHRVTHLHHQSQKIYQIGDLSAVRNLNVLYLYNNRIEKIEHLKAVPQLQMLYLQKNKISKIENLCHLKKLRKLYLSNNRISVVEDLQELTMLQELHIDHQDLKPGQNLVFDPRSCMGLKNLKILNTSKNQMLDLHPLELIPKLENLNVSSNLLSNLNGVINILCLMQNLKNLDLRHNPITTTLRYRESVIGACLNMHQIDGKSVETNSRILMKNLTKAKHKLSSTSSSLTTTSSSSMSNSTSKNSTSINGEVSSAAEDDNSK